MKALTSHVCANFNMLVAQRVAAGEPVLMSVAVHTVICADCGLQVPILGTVMEAYSSFIVCQSCYFRFLIVTLLRFHIFRIINRRLDYLMILSFCAFDADFSEQLVF